MNQAVRRAITLVIVAASLVLGAIQASQLHPVPTGSTTVAAATQSCTDGIPHPHGAVCAPADSARAGSPTISMVDLPAPGVSTGVAAAEPAAPTAARTTGASPNLIRLSISRT